MTDGIDRSPCVYKEIQSVIVESADYNHKSTTLSTVYKIKTEAQKLMLYHNVCIYFYIYFNNNYVQNPHMNNNYQSMQHAYIQLYYNNIYG